MSKRNETRQDVIEELQKLLRIKYAGNRAWNQAGDESTITDSYFDDDINIRPDEFFSNSLTKEGYIKIQLSRPERQRLDIYENTIGFLTRIEGLEVTDNELVIDINGLSDEALSSLRDHIGVVAVSETRGLAHAFLTQVRDHSENASNPEIDQEVLNKLTLQGAKLTLLHQEFQDLEADSTMERMREAVDGKPSAISPRLIRDSKNNTRFLN